VTPVVPVVPETSDLCRSERPPFLPTDAVDAAWALARSGVRSLRHRTRSAWNRRWTRVLVAMLAPSLLAVGALVHHLYWDRDGLPALEPFVRFEPPTTGEVEDAHGRVLIELAHEYRRVIGYGELPPVVRHAILAAEDKNFFEHGGIDYSAFPRVAWKTLAHSVVATWRASAHEGRLAPRVVFPQGGSTVTQQLVRGYFLPHMIALEDGRAPISEGLAARLASSLLGVSAANKIVRKVEEIRLSFWLEEEMARRFGSRRRAKEEILARYASFIYLGNGRYGFSAASEYYFGKTLASFTPRDADKAALLAGITKSPRDYAPGRQNLERSQRRRDDILRLMARRGFLGDAVAEAAVRQPIALVARSRIKTGAPAVVEHVFEELKRLGDDRMGVEALVRGRIRVQATVDDDVQRIVNEALENGLRVYESRHPRARGVIQGSVVVLHNEDGRVLAEAGGRQVFKDRYNSYSDYNRVTDSRRQPGSVMKPVVYLTAFRHGLTLDTEVPDEPISVPMGGNQPDKWISNYDGRFKGPIPIRKALAESRNAATIWLAQEMGVKEFLRTARDLGIKTRLQPYITTALGASEVNLLELANAYRTMATGRVAEPYVIATVSDSAGSVVHRPTRRPRPLGIDAGALRDIQEGLRGVIRLRGGTAHTLASAEFGIPVMGKTGTTSDFRDALFVGSTYGSRGITVAVRVGFDDNRQLGHRETGGRTALPIFREILERLYREGLVGPVPEFPAEMEERIGAYVEYEGEEVPEDPELGSPELPEVLVSGEAAVDALMMPAALVSGRPARGAAPIRPATPTVAAGVLPEGAQR
jgi:penicillin-binding protein 1A